MGSQPHRFTALHCISSAAHPRAPLPIWASTPVPANTRHACPNAAANNNSRCNDQASPLSAGYAITLHNNALQQHEPSPKRRFEPESHFAGGCPIADPRKQGWEPRTSSPCAYVSNEYPRGAGPDLKKLVPTTIPWRSIPAHRAGAVEFELGSYGGFDQSPDAGEPP